MAASTEQPHLRSFIVYDVLPEGCSVYPVVNDHNAPHLHTGDVAIIDPTDREPQVGELFVIEWSSDGGTAIVETWARPGRYGSGPNGEMIESVCWFAAMTNRARTREEALERMASGQPVGWCDGPYATEERNAGAINRKLRGKVVGILQPSFHEPRRLAARDC